MGQDRAHPVGERPARGRDHDEQVAEQSRHREGAPRGHGARDHRRDGGRTRPGSARRRLQRPGRLPVAEPDLPADGVAVDRQHPVGHAIGAGREQPREGGDHRRPVLRVGRGPDPGQRRAVRGSHHHRSAFRLDRLRERQPDLRRALLHDGARVGGAGDEGGVCRRRCGSEDQRGQGGDGRSDGECPPGAGAPAGSLVCRPASHPVQSCGRHWSAPLPTCGHSVGGARTRWRPHMPASVYARIRSP